MREMGNNSYLQRDQNDSYSTPDQIGFDRLDISDIDIPHYEFLCLQLDRTIELFLDRHDRDPNLAYYICRYSIKRDFEEGFISKEEAEELDEFAYRGIEKFMADVAKQEWTFDVSAIKKR